MFNTLQTSQILVGQNRPINKETRKRHALFNNYSLNPV